MRRPFDVLSDVKDVADLLEGARIDQARLVPAGGRLNLELELTRAVLEAQQVVRRGPFRRLKTTWIKGRLTLTQLNALALERFGDAGAQQKPLIWAEAIPGGYEVVITSPEGLRLRVTAEHLNGVYEDVGSPIESP